MAKTRAPKKPAPETTTDPLHDPKRLHELLGLAGPYDPPPAPIPTKGYRTFWDPGCSIQRLRDRDRTLFYATDFLDRSAVMKASDSWKWRMIRAEPFPADLTFSDQQKLCVTGDEVPSARELVTYLLLTFLTTGVRPEMMRWRCRDVLPSGRRVIVGPFLELGLDIGSVGDDWISPGVGLCPVRTPRLK